MHYFNLERIVFSPTADRFATSANDYFVRIWSSFGCAQTATGSPLDVATPTRRESSPIRWRANDGDKTHTIVFERAASNSPIAEIAVHHWGVRSVTLNSTSSRALIAQTDGEILLVDIAQSAIIARCRSEPSGILESASFADNDRMVVARTQDGAFWTWRILPDTQQLVSHAKSLLPRCLTPQQRRRFGLAPERPAWCAGKWAG